MKRSRRSYRSLADFLASSGKSQVQLAAAVEADQAQISRILNGRIFPRPHLAKRLVRYCRIPAESLFDAYIASHPDEGRS